jgi:hypothetical protein
MSNLLERAKKLQAGRAAKDEMSALSLEEKRRAYRELDERARIVSFPDYNGSDSHFAIQQDREALDDLPDFNITPDAEAEIGSRIARSG